MTDGNSRNVLSISSSSGVTEADRSKVILLTCYMTGAEKGANLGTPGYSYDFVAQIFMPLLGKWGQVIPVPFPKTNLDKEAERVLSEGLDPIHVSFLPFQDVTLSKIVPNVVVPAWEFPDIPDYSFDFNPQNDWKATGNHCDAVIVGGEFTKQTFESGGIQTPIHIVPVPTPTEYFEVSDLPGTQVAYEFEFGLYDPRKRTGVWKDPKKMRPWWKTVGAKGEDAVRWMGGKFLGEKRWKQVKGPYQRKLQQTLLTHKRSKSTPAKFSLPFKTTQTLPGNSIIYTSILNPADGRKNWVDLITGFQYALGEHEDAVLIVKLITGRPLEALKVIRYYLNRDVPHRCKIMFVTDFLSNEQMVSLAEKSTYYLQTTKAEGNCLPLMNFLAAGRPAISPCHTAIADYFNETMGFPVDSHAEPAAWPHDPQLRLRTSWQRLVWPSLVDQLRRSYEIAKYDRSEYEVMSSRCRQKMQSWAHGSVVQENLNAALDETFIRSKRASIHRDLVNEGLVSPALKVVTPNHDQDVSSKKVA